MFRRLVLKFARLTLAVMILAVLAFSIVKPASAAYPTIDITGVKTNETVTVTTHDFPANVNFTVRMDVAGNKAIDGIVVGTTNSGLGGSFIVTYRIPAELYGVSTIAIRLESVQGYYAYDWFVNRTSGTTTPLPTPDPVTIPVTGVKPYLRILGVEANEAVTVEATGMPAYTSFTVRVGPFFTFFRDYVYMTSVTSDASGYAKFTLTLPQVVQDVEMVTVRIDGGGHYAYNVFKNVDMGTTIPVTSTGTCQIVSSTPSVAVNRGSDFDGTWTIKNTSTKNWDINSVDYRYVSGAKFQQFEDRYDLGKTVKPGETVKVIVDMLAPTTSGFYTTNWALVDGRTTLCNLPLNLRVR